MQDKFLQFLGLAKKAGKISEGYNKCEDNIKRGNIRLIILSEDISINSQEKFERLSNSQGIFVLQGYTKEDLGAALGRDEIGVLGITEEGFSEKLIKLWNEEKSI